MEINAGIEQKIGEALVKRGVLNDQDVDAVLKLQRAGDKRLFGEIAIDLGVLNVRELMDYLRS